MKPGIRKVFTATFVFSLAMVALEHGGWWWAWLALAVWALTGFRLPRLNRLVKLFHAGWRKYKTHQKRKQLVRQQRRSAQRHQ